MRISAGRQMLFVFLVIGSMVVGNQVEAQQFVGLSASPSPVGISNSLTYTITVTNLSPTAENFIITNTLPASAPFQSANNPYGSVITNGSTVIFLIQNQIISGGLVQVTVTALPTTAALITDSAVVISGDLLYSAATSVNTQVTNPVVQQADLAVGMTVPSSTVFSNDWIVYGVSVTNLGPNTATGVFLTNTLPPGVGFKSVSPASPAPSVIGSNVVFNLGSLTNTAVRNFLLTVQPTNAGVLPFMSFVTNSVLDTNAANNLVSNNITVLGYFPASLVAYTNSAQIYDAQDGLLEQSILVSNVGPNTVAASRVIVTGLTKQQLFNAVGTNNGNPFVVYNAALNANQSVKLLMQYAASAYFSFTNSQLNPFAVTNLNLAPPAALATSTNLNIARILKLTNAASPLINGDMLIEFPTITNRTYTVIYSDNVLFSNAMMALPPIIAPANRTQWIDYGPPLTVSLSTNSPARFYQVFLNP